MSESVDAPRYMRWLPAETINRLGRLEFSPRGTVDGFIAGRHRSARKGASVEFAEHREYTPGDDLRKLDWKLIARRQRLYVREYVDETNLRATILLDTSGSMGYRGTASADRLSKLEYAQHLAAALSYVLVQQQDAVGFIAYDTKIKVAMPAKAQPAQVRRILTELDRLEPGGETESAAVMHEVAERVPRRSVVFLLSDLFGDPDAIVNALHHFRFRFDEVVVLQVMADEELEFPFAEMLRFEDAETQAFMNIDTLALRNEYLDRVGEFLARLRRSAGEMRISLELLNTKVPYAQALSDFLVRYQERGGLR